MMVCPPTRMWYVVYGRWGHVKHPNLMRLIGSGVSVTNKHWPSRFFCGPAIWFEAIRFLL